MFEGVHGDDGVEAPRERARKPLDPSIENYMLVQDVIVDVLRYGITPVCRYCLGQYFLFSA
jgi:hypothetical protein